MQATDDLSSHLLPFEIFPIFRNNLSLLCMFCAFQKSKRNWLFHKYNIQLCQADHVWAELWQSCSVISSAWVSWVPLKERNPKLKNSILNIERCKNITGQRELSFCFPRAPSNLETSAQMEPSCLWTVVLLAQVTLWRQQFSECGTLDIFSKRKAWMFQGLFPASASFMSTVFELAQYSCSS